MWKLYEKASEAKRSKDKEDIIKMYYKDEKIKRRQRDRRDPKSAQPRDVNEVLSKYPVST